MLRCRSLLGWVVVFLVLSTLAQTVDAAVLYSNTPSTTVPSKSITPATRRPVQSSVRLGATTTITVRTVVLKMRLSSASVSVGNVMAVSLVDGGVHNFVHTVRADEIDTLREIVFSGDATIFTDFILDTQLVTGGFVNNQVFGTATDSYGGAVSCVSISGTFPTCDEGAVSGLSDLWFRICDTAQCGEASASFAGLGDLPGGAVSSGAAGVSGDGTTVVGASQASSGTQAFRWIASDTAGMVGLGTLAGSSAHSSAFGVSRNGSVIVGDSLSALPGPEAFRWSAASGMVSLGLGGGPFSSEARSVSGDGAVIVGRNSMNRAFRWTMATGPEEIGASDGSIAYGVSDDGRVIVGSSSGQAFRWTGNGGLVPLGFLPGGDQSAAFATSVDGSIVVGSSTSSAGVQAFRWTQATGMVGLGGSLGGVGAGQAHGVSADGTVVVGLAQFSPSVDQEAFVWDATNGIRSLKSALLGLGLNLESWRLLVATGISHDGRTIVGGGINPSGNQEAWIARLDQASPVPVILVHGICGSPGSFGSMGNLLGMDGVPVAEPFDYSAVMGGIFGDVAIEELASLFALHVRQTLETTGASQVDVIAHSMGGLIVRAWIAGRLSVPAPYEGQIRRLVLAGTPNYGARGTAAVIPCSASQAEQLEFGSQFVWELHDAWLELSRLPDILFVVGTQADETSRLECNGEGCNDGAVEIASAVLPNTADDRIRYVPYRHADVRVIPPARGRTLVGIDSADHATYRVVREFIRTGAVLSQCCGQDTVDYLPPHLRGVAAEEEGLLLIRAEDSSGIPLGRRLILSFDPKVNARLSRAQGTVTAWGVGAGEYSVTVCVRGFAPEATPVRISAGRPSIPRTIELTRAGIRCR